MYKTEMNKGLIGSAYLASKGVVDVHGHDINGASKETTSSITRMEQFIEEKQFITKDGATNSGVGRRNKVSSQKVRRFTISV